MKQRILSIFATLTLVASSAMAQTLTVSDVEATPGAQTVITVNIAGATDKSALQYNLSLPEGLALAENTGDCGITLGNATNGHTLSVSPLASGELLIVLYSMYQSSFSDGTLMTIPVVAAADTGISSGSLNTIRTATVGAASSECADVAFSAKVGSLAKEIILADGVSSFSQGEDALYDKITYTRTLNNTEWNALYLPFEIPVSQLTDKYEVAYINAIHSYDEDDNGEIDRMSMEVIKLREGTLHANHPYLIKARTAAAKQMSITVENTTLYKAESRTLDCSSVYTKFEITGIYEKMTSAQLAGCYALSGGSWKNLSSGSSLNPFRLYLRVSSREGSPVKLSEAALARIGIHVQGEETATSVEERLMQKQHKADAVYDLSGRRVTSPKKGQTYIVNGKKRMY